MRKCVWRVNQRDVDDAFEGIYEWRWSLGDVDEAFEAMYGWRWSLVLMS